MGLFREDSFIEDTITTIQLAIVGDKDFKPRTLFIAEWEKLPSLESQSLIKKWQYTLAKDKYDDMVAYKETISELNGKKEVGKRVVIELFEKGSKEKGVKILDRGQFKELIADGVLVEATTPEIYTKAMLRGLDVRRQI